MMESAFSGLLILFALGSLAGASLSWLYFRSKLTSLKLKIKHQDIIAEERETAIKAAASPLTQAFQDIANKSLQANSENFLRLAEQNLSKQQERSTTELKKSEKAVENLVNPIKKALEQSQKQITELEKSRSEDQGGIKTLLEEMKQNNKSLSDETNNLVNALRRPEVRGRWGEMTLKRVVEIAGMSEHCDFTEQVHTKSSDGVIRPDMIVRMPDNRDLVVDAKTPIENYLNATECDDKDKETIFLKKHAKNVREHIKLLSKKAYWDQFPQSPEFVILFIPGENFLIAALREDQSLMEYALSNKLILATPANFIALLKTVEYGWRQLALADNANIIKSLAEDLYSRLATFVNHLNKVGNQLSSSVDNYNKAVGSLERNVIPGARKFKELGVNSKKELEEIKQLDRTTRKIDSQKD